MFDLEKWNSVLKTESYLTHLERFPNRQLSGVRCSTFGCKHELFDVTLDKSIKEVTASCEQCGFYGRREVAKNSPLKKQLTECSLIDNETHKREREFNIDLYAKYKYLRSIKRKTIAKRIFVIISTVSVAIVSKYLGL